MTFRDRMNYIKEIHWCLQLFFKIKNSITQIDHSHNQSTTSLAPVFTEDNFSMDWDKGDGLGTIQVHYLYCALYFYHYYDIRSTSDHQAQIPAFGASDLHYSLVVTLVINVLCCFQVSNQISKQCCKNYKNISFQ